jgi:hypothetical protein
LHQLFNRLPRLGFPFARQAIPHDGIYILFQKGEEAHGGDRIVRVGTHTGEGQLPSRLEQHFLKPHKDRSIFRKNVGRALLNKGHDPFLDQWEIDLTTSEAKKKYRNLIDFTRLRTVEDEVSKYIQDQFTFTVFSVPPKEQRLRLESRIISTLSLCDGCRPSNRWLGLYSPKDKIRESGLWLVNELYKQPCSAQDLQQIRDLTGFTDWKIAGPGSWNGDRY